jgi:hypothetical protein
MKNTLLKSILKAIAILLITSTPAIAQSSNGLTPKNNLPVGNYPIFDANNDWRSGQNVPWSTPTYVKDAFDGDYLAVFDKNFSGNTFFEGSESGVISNWSRRSIRIYAYKAVAIRGFFTSSTVSNVLETKLLEIKLGDRIFRLQGEDGNYTVSDELAKALASAPEEVIKTRIMLKGSGQTIVNDIGIDTVRSWRTVYAN